MRNQRKITRKSKENPGKSKENTKIWGKFRKIQVNPRKSKKITENPIKSEEIKENLGKSLKKQKSGENLKNVRPEKNVKFGRFGG